MLILSLLILASITSQAPTTAPTPNPTSRFLKCLY